MQWVSLVRRAFGALWRLRVIETSVIETRFVLTGKAHGLTRKAPGGRIPVKVRDSVVLCTPDGEPYAKCIVMSVRRGSVSGCDDAWARRDGFSNATSWRAHWRNRYGDSDGVVYQMQLRVDEKITPEGTWSRLDVHGAVE